MEKQKKDMSYPLQKFYLKKIASSQKMKKIEEIIDTYHSSSIYNYLELDIHKEADKIINIEKDYF